MEVGDERAELFDRSTGRAGHENDVARRDGNHDIAFDDLKSFG